MGTQEQAPLCRGMVQLSHKSQIDFVSGVKTQFPEFFEGGRVLEIGSLDINGSVRDFFVNRLYQFVHSFAIGGLMEIKLLHFGHFFLHVQLTQYQQKV